MGHTTLKNRLLNALLPAFFIVATIAPLKASIIAEGTGRAPETAGAQAVILDEDLRDDLAVDSYTTGFTQNHLMVAQANLRSRTDHDLAIQAQTIFKDKYGVALNTEHNAWTTIIISAHGTHYYQSQSLTPNAAQYTIRLRYIKRPNSDDYK